MGMGLLMGEMVERWRGVWEVVVGERCGEGGGWGNSSDGGVVRWWRCGKKLEGGELAEVGRRR